MHNTRPPGRGIQPGAIAGGGRTRIRAAPEDSDRRPRASGAPVFPAVTAADLSFTAAIPPAGISYPRPSLAWRRGDKAESTEERHQALRPPCDPCPGAFRRTTRDGTATLDPVHGWPAFRWSVRARGGPCGRFRLSDCGAPGEGDTRGEPGCGLPHSLRKPGSRRGASGRKSEGRRELRAALTALKRFP